MSEFIRVDFSQPMPLFPLPDTVLLPHAVLPFHIFEPRYRQMIKYCLEGEKQIAMACFEDSEWKDDYFGSPPLRDVVCVGQIVRHETLSGGRHDILLHGVCRARISKIIEPEEEREYRMALLTPLEEVNKEPPPMNSIRRELLSLLHRPRLQRMRAAKDVAEWFSREDVTTHALLELIGAVLLHDSELKYRLLSEPSAQRRAGIIRDELIHLDHIVGIADRHDHDSWPKGLSWN